MRYDYRCDKNRLAYKLKFDCPAGTVDKLEAVRPFASVYTLYRRLPNDQSFSLNASIGSFIRRN